MIFEDEDRRPFEKSQKKEATNVPGIKKIALHRVDTLKSMQILSRNQVEILMV